MKFLAVITTALSFFAFESVSSALAVPADELTKNPMMEKGGPSAPPPQYAEMSGGFVFATAVEAVLIPDSGARTSYAEVPTYEKVITTQPTTPSNSANEPTPSLCSACLNAKCPYHWQYKAMNTACTCITCFPLCFTCRAVRFAACFRCFSEDDFYSESKHLRNIICHQCCWFIPKWNNQTDEYVFCLDGYQM